MATICNIGGINHSVDETDMTKRRISLEYDFMKHNKNDIMYGYLLYLATYDDENKIVYLTREKFNQSFEDTMVVTGYASKKSLYNNLDKWKKDGLIYDGFINGEISYIFKNYDDKGKYQLVTKSMIPYIIKTRNKCCLRVYTYLLNKWLWKKDGYEFTYKELRQVLGYSDKPTTYKTANETIKIILASLKREGILSISNYYKEIYNDGRVTQTPVFCVHNVVENVSELKDVHFINYK